MYDNRCAEIADVSGPAEAHTIIFLHGLAWNRQMWMYQQRELEKEFLVVTIDLLGHGSQADEPFQLDQAIQNVITSITYVHKKRVLLVGLSLGGYVAIACAHRHPELIAGIVISGSCVIYQGWLALLARINGLLLSRIYSEKMLIKMQEAALLSIYPGEYVKPLIEAGFHFKKSGEAFFALAGKDFRKELHTYPGPVLIVNGADDQRNRKAEEAMLAAAQHTQLVIIENAGHLCSIDQPMIFTKAIFDFAHTISWDAIQQ